MNALTTLCSANTDHFATVFNMLTMKNNIINVNERVYYLLAERFRMVRVGRAEAMHSVAANISSQQLALREITRINEQPPTTAGLSEEVRTHI